MSASETPVMPRSHAIRADARVSPRLAEPRARILSVSANPDDHVGLKRMIDHKIWQLATARTCRNARRQLERNVAVVFSECALPDGTWKDMLNHIAQMDRPPQLIVTSRLADAYLWSEVLNLGGFDVLAKPLNEREVRQVLAAVSRFRAQPGRLVRTAGTM